MQPNCHDMFVHRELLVQSRGQPSLTSMIFLYMGFFVQSGRHLHDVFVYGDWSKVVDTPGCLLQLVVCKFLCSVSLNTLYLYTGNFGPKQWALYAQWQSYMQLMCSSNTYCILMYFEDGLFKSIHQDGFRKWSEFIPLNEQLLNELCSLSKVFPGPLQINLLSISCVFIQCDWRQNKTTVA